MPKRRGTQEEPEYKGKAYKQWVNDYNKGQAGYEDYLIARKILVDGIDEEQAIKGVEDARTIKEEQVAGGGEDIGED